MTSKEALEELREDLEDNDFDKKYIKRIYNTIKQDLERLEVLEKDNKRLKDFWLETTNKLVTVETENEQLKDSIKIKQKQVNKCIDTLTQENEKLKKAIEILKDYTFIEFDDVDIYLKSSNCPLSYQEYKLLKEVLGK
jgi:hypothetical protein